MAAVTKYRFLLSGRWAAILLLAIAVMVTCVFLGSWQWSRHEDRAARNAIIEGNYDASPVALDELVSHGRVDTADEWRPVELEGRYVGEQLTLRNRPVAGTNASRVLATLELGDGTQVVVDRGWLPGTDQAPPAYPAGDVAVLGRLRLAEGPDEREAPAGQVYAVHPPAVIAATGAEEGEALAGYVMAHAESPQAGVALEPFPRPETTPGSHLSYAVQWWLFVLGGPIGFVLLARREANDHHPRPVSSPTPRPRPSRRGQDADEEDAAIDAQLAAQARLTSSR